MAPDMRVLTRMKANYSSAGAESDLHLMWEEGVLKLVGGGGASMGKEHEYRVERCKNEALHLVKQAWTDGAPFRERRGHPLEIHQAMQERLKIHGFQKAEITEAVSQLILNGDVVIGRTSDKRGYKADAQ